MPEAVTVKNLSVQIRGCEILKNVSFSLSEVEIACLLGPSGCGKTTLLRCIAGFERPQRGEIWIRGVHASDPVRQIPVEKRLVGMVFQDYALFPHLDVAGNITFGLQGLKPEETRRRLDELLELFSLQSHVHHYPHDLSGGQQQRVALARAMAPSPDVLLLDEPFASLDIELREQIARELHQILKQHRITTIMVSHNQLEAFAMADVVGIMNEGRLLQWDTAFKLYHQPASPTVADFIGEGVFIPGRIIDDYAVKTEIGDIHGHSPHGMKRGQSVKVLLRPDDILHDDSSQMNALVKEKAFRGAAFLYTLELTSGRRILSLVPSHHDHPVGKPIGIRTEIDHLVIFRRTEAG